MGKCSKSISSSCTSVLNLHLILEFELAQEIVALHFPGISNCFLVRLSIGQWIDWLYSLRFKKNWGLISHTSKDLILL